LAILALLREKHEEIIPSASLNCEVNGLPYCHYNGRYWLGGKPVNNCGWNVNIRVGGNRVTVTVPPRVRRGKFDQRKREAIKGFSATSISRMVRYLRESEAEYKGFFTCTFPLKEGYGFDGKEANRCIRVFLQRLKRHFGNQKGYSTFYFKEFHKVGALHLHGFTTAFIPKRFLSQIWFEIVGSGLEKHLSSGTNIQSFKSGKFGVMAYARKYAAKQAQKTIPEGFLNFGRFWGISGNRRVSATTLPLHDISKLSSDWEVQLSKLSGKLKQLERKKKARKHTVLVSREDTNGNMVRDLDVGCTIWDLTDPVGIKEIHKIAARVASGESRVEFGGWLCEANGSKAMRERKMAEKAFKDVFGEERDWVQTELEGHA
jgi:hypothetical protein